MNVKAVVGLIFLFLSFHAKANERRIDSLRNLVKTNIHDTSMVGAYIDLAYDLRIINPSEAEVCLKLATELAQNIHYTKGINGALHLRAMFYLRDKEYIRSCELLYQTIDAAEKDNDISLLSSCYLSLGDILLQNRSYDLARKYIYTSFKYSLIAKDTFASGLAKRLIATTFYRKGEYAQAAEEFKDAVKYYHNPARGFYAYSVINDIGLCYRHLKEYKKALYYFNLSLNLAHKHDPVFAGLVKGNIGEVLMLQSKFDAAISYLLADVHQNRDNKHEVNSLSNTYSQLANCYYNKKKLSTALLYIDSSIALRETGQINDNLFIDELKLKSAILAAMGRNKEAYNVVSMALALREDDHLARTNVALLETQVSHEAIRKEREMNSLRNQLSTEMKLRYYYVTIIILVVILLVVFLYSLYRSRRSYKTLHMQSKLNEQQQKELDLKNSLISTNNKELIEANEKLHELNEEKNEFIRLVAHDLKNPISRVSGLTYLIENEPDSLVKDQFERLDYIKMSALEMTNLIERFLDVNRIESGHQKIKPELFNLVEIIQNQINNFKLQAQEKLLEVRFEYPNPNLEVESDKQIITLIFVNLLSNAIKFSGFNKLIEVEITMDTQNYWLHIRDQGPGMTEQDKLLVFKKYTRLSARPTANETSTGLGLYLVKKMSEKINAEILFESTLGVGTEMKVKIPFNIGRPV